MLYFVFNDASSVGIYLWNLCHLLQSKAETEPESCELLGTQESGWSISQLKEYLAIPDFKLEIHKIKGEID